MRNRNIQRMVRRGEITHEEGVAMAAAHKAKVKKTREEPIDYCNHEGYADPTAFYAVWNIAH